MIKISKRTLVNCIENQWSELMNYTKDAVVLLDNSAAECLHWHGGLKKLLESGAVSVENFSPFVKADSRVKKVVFILMSPLIGETWKTVAIILRANSFKNCVIVNSLPAKCHNDSVDPDVIFMTLESQLCNWIQDKAFIAKVCHNPICLAHICQNFFLMSSFSENLSIFQCGLNEMNTKKSDDLQIKNISRELQAIVKQTAYSLVSFLDTLQVKCDVFSLGTISHFLASDLENICQLQKKSHSSKASLVIVDRLLDLAGPLSQSYETMLDKILLASSRLPGHTFDVCIPMDDLSTAKSDTVFGRPLVAPGCLAHKNLPVEEATLNSILFKKPREVLIDVNRSIVECASKEGINLDLNARLTPAVLRQRVARFKEEPKSIVNHLGVLQQALGVALAMEFSTNNSIDNLSAIEKALLEYLAQSPEEVLNHVMQMISEKEEMNYRMEDILTFLAFFFMLSGETDIANESAMQATLMDELFQNENMRDFSSLFIDEDHDDDSVLNSVRTLFGVFKRLGVIRRRLKKYSSVFKSSNPAFPAAYDPLLKQLLDDIFDPSVSDIPDLEFHSGGLKDYIKTGFSLFMNVTKPRPRDNPAVLLAVLGGVTPAEIKMVQELSQKRGTEILLISNTVLSPRDVLKDLGLIVKEIVKDDSEDESF